MATDKCAVPEHSPPSLRMHIDGYCRLLGEVCPGMKRLPALFGEKDCTASYKDSGGGGCQQLYMLAYGLSSLDIRLLTMCT